MKRVALIALWVIAGSVIIDRYQSITGIAEIIKQIPEAFKVINVLLYISWGFGFGAMAYKQ